MMENLNESRRSAVAVSGPTCRVTRCALDVQVRVCELKQLFGEPIDDHRFEKQANGHSRRAFFQSAPGLTGDKGALGRCLLGLAAA